MNSLPHINIRRIKEVSFFIDESSIGSGGDRRIKMEIGQQLGFAFPENYIELTISIFYYFENIRPRQKLCEIVVQNIFEISNLVNYRVNDNEILLPKETISIAFSTAISHTRGILSIHLHGSLLELPFLANGYDVARHFYPQMFLDNSNSAESVPTHKQIG